MKLPDFEAWAIFAKVAEWGSFARAADEVQLSKPTVSKAVSRLEQDLGVSLFNRTSRQLSLTEEGRNLLGHANRMVAEALAAQTQAQDGGVRPAGLVRLAVPMGFGVRHVAPLLPRFLETYPDIDVTIDLSDALVDLVSEGYDLALRIATLADSSLRARKLCDVRLLLVASPAFLDRTARPQHPRELQDRDSFVYANTSAPGMIHLHNVETGQDFVLSQTSRLRANNADAFVSSLEAGLGYGLFPEFMIHDALLSGRVEQILPEWQVPSIALYLVTPPSPLRPARVNVLMNYLTECFSTPVWMAVPAA